MSAESIKVGLVARIRVRAEMFVLHLRAVLASMPTSILTGVAIENAAVASVARVEKRAA